MKVIESMELQVEKPMIVYSDNNGAVDLANGWSVTGTTKHMEVRIMFLRELKEQKILEVKWVPTKSNASDIFTKNVDGGTFLRHVSTFCDGSILKQGRVSQFKLEIREKIIVM